MGKGYITARQTLALCIAQRALDALARLIADVDEEIWPGLPQEDRQALLRAWEVLYTMLSVRGR